MTFNFFGGRLAAPCAMTARGQATTIPLSRLMNSRRCMRSPDRSTNGRPLKPPMCINSSKSTHSIKFKKASRSDYGSARKGGQTATSREYSDGMGGGSESRNSLPICWRLQFLAEQRAVARSPRRLRASGRAASHPITVGKLRVQVKIA